MYQLIISLRYTNKYPMDNVKGVNHGSQIILFLVIQSFKQQLHMEYISLS
jgi:hypothetical protein